MGRRTQLNARLEYPYPARLIEKSSLPNYIDNWTWNLQDTNNGPQKIHTSGGVLGTRVLNRGRFYWEITFIPIYSAVMVFGVGTEKIGPRYISTQWPFYELGENEHCWGLSDNGDLVTEDDRGRYTTFDKHTGKVTVIGLYFDGTKGTLTFYKDGKSLGVAFTGLNLIQDKLFPLVSCFKIIDRVDTEIILGKTMKECENLQGRCRSIILNSLKNDETDINELNLLPNRLKTYLFEGTPKRAFLHDKRLSYIENARKVISSPYGPCHAIYGHCNAAYGWNL